MGSAVVHLARDQALQAQLRSDPTQIPAAVEEFLRMYSPYRVFSRTPVHDVELGGQHIRKDEPIAMIFPSANRDEEIFESPHEFRLNRNPNPHIAFGVGTHRCPAAPLARLELRVMLEELLAHTDTFRLDGDVTMMNWLEFGPSAVPLLRGRDRGSGQCDVSGPASNPQHILVTLLGTHFFGQQQPIPSGFLVDLLDEFGVSEIGARNALSRVTRRGLLEFSRSGRTTFYQLSAEAHRNHSTRLVEILRGADAPAWDGTWTVVLFSISEEQRALRHVVRTRLTRLRFGMLYDGVWVRPGPTDSTAADMLQALAAAEGDRADRSQNRSASSGSAIPSMPSRWPRSTQATRLSSPHTAACGTGWSPGRSAQPKPSERGPR